MGWGPPGQEGAPPPYFPGSLELRVPCPTPGAPQSEMQRGRRGAQGEERGDRPAFSLSHPTPDPNPSLEFYLGKVAGRGEVWARVTSGFSSGLRGRGQAKEVFSVVLLGEGRRAFGQPGGFLGPRKLGILTLGQVSWAFSCRLLISGVSLEGATVESPVARPPLPKGRVPLTAFSFIHSLSYSLTPSLKCHGSLR